MRFSRYMQEWLYGEKGYYTRFRPIGKGGDFYTAVSASAFFGASIANFIFQNIQSKIMSEELLLVEIGAHQGYLLCDMIQWLYTCRPSLIHSMRFGIVEPYAALQERQKEYIKSRFGSDVKVEHFHDLSEVHGKDICYVANEIFDAFACDLYHDGQIATVCEHQIVWERADESTIRWAREHRLQKGEIAVGYEDFASKMAKSASGRCDFITFDYGEKYVRNDFSIRIYRQHETFPLFDDDVDLPSVFQTTDLTYDVNFGHLMEAFEASGMKTVAYETQARALIRFGIIDILQQYAKQADYQAYLREADKIKTLISPTVMGDKFKMLHVCK